MSPLLTGKLSRRADKIDCNWREVAAARDQISVRAGHAPLTVIPLKAQKQATLNNGRFT